MIRGSIGEMRGITPSQTIENVFPS